MTYTERDKKMMMNQLLYMQTKKEEKIIVEYIKKMQQLSSNDMLKYYRYTRENQEEGEELKKFYEFEDKFCKYAKELEIIVKKMLKQIKKNKYPLLNGHVSFCEDDYGRVSLREDDCGFYKQKVLLIKQVVANNSNEELLRWLECYATSITVENGKIIYNG